MNTSSNRPNIKLKAKSKARHPMIIFLVSLLTVRAGFHLEQSPIFKGKSRA